ncbi:unnamed protein product [Prunus armeniaca]|uniref:Secreted protein n=1 Tax=Prunus armeniaca TaxID=36596 RepID=A0A6J5UJZ1_PRUAR|nr:unnamed protein product [Prunus armeniaca]
MMRKLFALIIAAHDVSVSCSTSCVLYNGALQSVLTNSQLSKAALVFVGYTICLRKSFTGPIQY